ncbi:aspartate racemase [Lipingzhangella halophila]|uniref:Aspartate racemase n=1 Tax=Lipingzhangella halophila TaxID=1783352 RepID=A0A7W7RJ80_9ACTN|nr:aspartate/glutamate racemase family protein [Lipingzhangella halophila]MBB4933004.1 aspartate racemase [Lipingzhangella halophila]
MRVIGMLGGMSWESTSYYYQELNRAVRDRLGGLHSAHCVVYSVDFDAVERMQAAGDWERAGNYLAECAQRLEAAGAECVVLCTNTMHRVFGEVQRAISVPMLHIADSTADALESAGVRKVALLGTRYTMEQAFYRERLEGRGLTVVVPSAADRDLVHRTIFDELCLGKTVDSSRAEFERIVADLGRSDDVEGVILGCTEIGLLLGQENSPLPVFDTTLLHVEAALDWSLR